MREAIFLETISAMQANRLRRPALGAVSNYAPENHLVADDRTRHFGVFVGDRLAGVASVSPEAPPGERDRTAWRVQGVATEPEFESAGLDMLLVHACVNYATARGGAWMWCTVMAAATDLFTKNGFQRRRPSQPTAADACLMHLAL